MWLSKYRRHEVSKPKDLNLLPKLQYHTKPRVIFSLTTIPSRIQTIEDTIQHLLDSSIKPDKVILNLPDVCKREGLRYIIPSNLLSLQRKYPNQFLINKCKIDYGPATKILPTLMLEKHPQTRIFPIDDDCIFPPKYFEELLYNSILCPNVAFGYHGLDIDSNGSPSFAQHRTGDVDVVETVTGAVYRRGMFNDTIFDIPDKCFTTDDIWINHHVKNNGFKRRLLLSQVDGYFERGRDGMPMLNRESSNPLWMLNIVGSNNLKCTKFLLMN